MLDLQTRLRHWRRPAQSAGPAWEDGVAEEWLEEFLSYWAEGFDWRTREAEINRWPHYRANLAGASIHFIHQRGRGPEPMPLVLTHGWPGSFLEIEKILPLLTDPGAHGGDPADAFDLVVPSLPGFGYSTLPPGRGMNAFQIADAWDQLMRGLGYHRYGAQGGDFGAAVNTALGLRHSASLIGIHLNYIPGTLRPRLGPESPPLAPVEQEFLAGAEQWYDADGAYAHVHRTRPRTLAYALEDSPAGLAAWILEKFLEWSDCGGRVESRFTRDELLSNVTLYWVTRSGYTASRLYFEMARQPLHLGPGERVTVPCGIARFAKESPFPPRSWIERAYRVVHWSEFPSGGHFAAMEEPERLAEDIRAFFRPLRSRRTE
jgi:pimeloyl-ACP methyl ester carboxylesterase